MYARHLGWLNATPEGDKMSRRDELSKGGEGSPFLEMPELEEAAYLIAYWHDAGTCSVSGMGISPLTWLEIRAWRLENEMYIDGFEIKAIRLLSSEYVSEYHAATDKSRPAPFSPEEENLDRVLISSKVSNLLSGFKKNNAESSYEVSDRE